MNKRNTEGYVLAYVLVVVVVMGAIATALMTSTLNVIKAQENSIEYMKDKYAAMGEIEKLVATLTFFPPFGDDDGGVQGAKDSFNSKVKLLFPEISASFDDSLSSPSNGIYTYVIDYTSTNGTVSVNSQIHTRLSIEVDTFFDDQTDPENPVTYYPYTVEILDSSFHSYEIVGGDS